MLYGSETWPVRAADERVLVVFGNDSIRSILRVRRINGVTTLELRCCLRLTNTPAQLVQSGPRYFGQGGRRLGVGMIKDPRLPTPSRERRKRTGNQLETLEATHK